MKDKSSNKTNENNRLPSDVGVRLSLVEQNIYEGLKSIGEEISSFYLDAIKLLNSSEFESQNYLISHLLREIDGGLRDVLSPLSNETETCKKCGQKIQKTTHFEEICLILGVPNTDETAKRWRFIAKQFPKYAHRSGAWNQPRKVDEIKKLWNEYEDILFRLVGNHLNLLNQMDRKLAGNKPTNEFLATLPNLLLNKSLKYYFFKELKYPDWFLSLRESKFFSPEQIYSDATSIVDYIIRVGKENSKEGQVQITEELLKIVNECVDYRAIKIRKENPYIVDAAILELCTYLPVDRVPKNVLKLLEYSIEIEPNFSFVLMSASDNFIPFVLKNKNDDLYEAFIRIILDYDLKDRTYPDYESKINDSQLLELLRKSKKLILENHPTTTLKVALDIINQILIEDPDAFNYWRVATIEDSSQLTFLDRYQVQLVQLVRDILLIVNQDKCDQIIIEWIKSEHALFRRISYFLINKRYAKFSNYFWDLKENPLDDEDCMHELYEFLREHSKEFSEDKINKILDWIESVDYYISDSKTKAQKERIIALRKREWLSAIVDSENQNVRNKIKEYEKIDPTPLNHPGHRIWHESSYGFKSPVDVAKFKTLPVEELIEELKKVKYSNDSEALDNRGLNIQLADLVKDDPQKFSNEIAKFFDLNISFQSDIINGLTNAWNGRKQINWESTLGFVLSIIKQKSFWDKDYGKGYDFRNSFLRYVCELITAGTKSDENAFDEKYLNKVEEILLIFDQKISDSGSGFNDAATHFLNSTFGKFYDALLNLSLRYARVHKDSKQDLWLPSIKRIFNRRLDRKSEPSIDISVCLGGFLPNFNFLDRQWVSDNINLIFPKENEPHWQAAMEGYLSFARSYYEDIYILLRNNNNVLKGIISDFERQLAENLFAHIFFAHISGLEKLDDTESMLFKLIDSGKYNSIIAHFLWAQRENPNVKAVTVFPIWKKIFNQIKINLKNENNRRIISNLTQLLCYFENIPDDLFEILSFSTNYLKSGFGTVHFVEELFRLRKKELDKVGKLFSKLLDNDDYPTYKTEHIKEIMEELFINGYKELANEICNRYAKKNILFLRDIYSKYNKI